MTGPPPKEEFRIEDTIKDGEIGISFVVECCGKGFCTDGGQQIDNHGFIPMQIGASQKMRCKTCGRVYEISFMGEAYEIMMADIEILYKRKKLITLCGKCRCQHNCLRDGYTQEVCQNHCVDSRISGDYPFFCRCRNTSVMVSVRDTDDMCPEHFHLYRKGEEPKLTAKRSEEQEVYF